MRFFRQIGELKGWKRFGFEVGIIVIGLSITLIAQELITSANRARETRLAMDAVEGELVMMLVYTSERMAIEPCRQGQTQALAALLQQTGDAWPSLINNDRLNHNLDGLMLPVVLRTPSRPFPDSSWRALLASDAAMALDREAFAALNNIYDVVLDLRQGQIEAWRLKGRLSHLAAPGILDAAQRREARAVLGELSAIEALITINAAQLREYLVSMDFRNERRFDALFASATAKENLDAFVADARPIYGACIDDVEYQPIYDHFNALTGANAVIPPRDVAP